MVNVDDLNEAIEAFGNISKRFNEIQVACQSLDELSTKIGSNAEQVQQLIKDVEMFKTEIANMENELNRKVEYSESNIKDKVALSQNEIIRSNESAINNVITQIDAGSVNITTGLVNIANNLYSKLDQLKIQVTDLQKKRVINWIGLAVIIIFQVFSFFVYIKIYW